MTKQLLVVGCKQIYSNRIGTKIAFFLLYSTFIEVFCLYILSKYIVFKINVTRIFFGKASF